MKQYAYIGSLSLLLLLPTAIQANWVSGDAATISISNGNATAHLPLTSAQSLDVTIFAYDNTPTMDMYFNTKDKEHSLVLKSLSVAPQGSEDTVTVSVTPLVDDDSGDRFYLIESGTAEGTRIISYRKGIHSDIFTASSALDRTVSKTHFSVNRKTIQLMVSENGVQTTYDLSYDKKQNTFILV